MVVTINKNVSPQKIRKELKAMDDKTEKRVEQLSPFFGVLKRDINPLKLQKKWRNEWE